MPLPRTKPNCLAPYSHRQSGEMFRYFRLDYLVGLSSGIVSLIYYVYYALVFSQFLDCKTSDSDITEDSSYLCIFVGLIFLAVVMFVPTAIESARKSIKYIYYYACSWENPLPSSPGWMKRVASVSYSCGAAITGGILGASIFSSTPKDAPTLTCVAASWDDHLWPRIVAILCGVGICVTLSYHQLRSYYGRDRKLTCGKNATTIAYMLYWMIGTLFPLVRNYLNSTSKYTTRELAFRLVMVLYLCVLRFKVFQEANEISLHTRDVQSMKDYMLKKQREQSSCGRMAGLVISLLGTGVQAFIINESLTLIFRELGIPHILAPATVVLASTQSLREYFRYAVSLLGSKVGSDEEDGLIQAVAEE